ncbi:MAG: M50 family metallopeptidase [archaeon]
MILFNFREIRDIVITILLTSLVFLIAFQTQSLERFYILILIVTISIIGHELWHKLFAMKNNIHAEFYADIKSQLLGVLFAIIGFIILSPGYVKIESYEKRLSIELAPLYNLILAVISLFIIQSIRLTYQDITLVTDFTFFINNMFRINSFLAFFNFLPLNNFDGKKIRSHNKTLSNILIVSSLILVILSFILI